MFGLSRRRALDIIAADCEHIALGRASHGQPHISADVVRAEAGHAKFFRGCVNEYIQEAKCNMPDKVLRASAETNPEPIRHLKELNHQYEDVCGLHPGTLFETC